MLLLQQFLTRAFTILFNSGLAFFAISVTFLGLGSAGVCVAVLGSRLGPARAPRLVPPLALGYALALVLGFAAIVTLDHAAVDGVAGDGAFAGQVLRVITASLCLLPAMFLVGLVIALVLHAHADRVHRLYGADLVGGGLGCLLVLPLMTQVGGDHGIFAIGMVAGAGAALLSVAYRHRAALRLALLVLAMMAVAPWCNRDRALLDVRSHRTALPGVEQWVLEDQEQGRAWNQLARLGFFPTRDQSAMYVRIDSSCQTTIPSTRPEHTRAYVASLDFEHLPYVLDRHRRYLEIGAGGGRGMVLAQAHGAETITGVEINPDIVAAARDRFPGFGVTELTRNPAHQLVVDEGRSYVRSDARAYDTVTITFIQTGSASASAAFALSEANLFTVEAFTEFLGRLSDDGLFYVYRMGGNEMLRLIGLAREALRAFGIQDPRPHLYIARNAGNQAVLMVGRRPFTPEESARLDQRSRELGLQVLFDPHAPASALPPNPLPARVRELRARGALDLGEVARLYRDLAHAPDCEPIERSYLAAADPEAFLDDYVVDVRPPHDDRPYFFFTGLNRWQDFLHYFDRGSLGILGGTVTLLFWMGAAFTVLVLLLILLPLLLRRVHGVRRGTGLAVVTFFSGLGLGYVAVQISFIQRFVLFLGHPVYALSVLVLAFLASSGVGSMYSSRLFRSGRLTFARTVLGLVALLLAYNQALPAIFHSELLGWPVAARIALSVALIFPPAFLMGLLFPQGIRLVHAAAPALTPWAWGANSAASVLGAILALILSIHFGFTAVAVTAAAIYAGLCLPASALLLRAAREA